MENFLVTSLLVYAGAYFYKFTFGFTLFEGFVVALLTQIVYIACKFENKLNDENESR